MKVAIKDEESDLIETFITDASDEDIRWIIAVNKNKYDLIRNWDRNKIISNIGWVSYHIRRAGFEVSEMNEIFQVDELYEVEQMKILK